MNDDNNIILTKYFCVLPKRYYFKYFDRIVENTDRIFYGIPVYFEWKDIPKETLHRWLNEVVFKEMKNWAIANI